MGATALSMSKLFVGTLVLFACILVVGGNDSRAKVNQYDNKAEVIQATTHSGDQHGHRLGQGPHRVASTTTTATRRYHASGGQRRLQGFQFPQEAVAYNDDNANVEPIRIRFLTNPLESIRGTSESIDTTIDTVLDEILPRVQEKWATHLFLNPAVGPVPVTSNNCGVNLDFSPLQAQVGGASGSVGNADLVIGVFLNLQANECTASSLAFATPCTLDQVDRPIFGVINFCKTLENSPEEITDVTLVAIHEVGHVLGHDSRLFKYFRDANTGEPLTPRPFTPSTVQCVDGSTRSMVFPAQNTLKLGQSSFGFFHYEIVTPRVRTVVRNHFDCQTLDGARLENQPTAEADCTGTHWDERLFFNELMSSIIELGGNVKDNVLSPLTLALMEDSGWYKVWYGGTQLLPFGQGRGCDFVNQDCIIDNAVPGFGVEVFCDVPLIFSGELANDIDNPVFCNPSHTNLALCELLDRSTAPARFPLDGNPSYFDNQNLVSLNQQPDYCPLPIQELENIQCDNEDTDERFQFYFEEKYGPGSRCVNAVFEGAIMLPNGTTMAGSFQRAACVPIVCDSTNFRVVMAAKVCEFDGQVLPASQGRGSLVCPRLATVCPELYCPGSCSGRGACNYNANPPRCDCFDSADTSPLCSEPSSGPTFSPVTTPSPTKSSFSPPFSGGSTYATLGKATSLLTLLAMISSLAAAFA